MRIALPIDTANYGKRLDYLEKNQDIEHVDFIIWPFRDFDSFGGNTKNFYKAVDAISERLKKIEHVKSISTQLSYFLTAHPTIDWNEQRRSFQSCKKEIRDTMNALVTMISDNLEISEPYLSMHHQLEMPLSKEVDLERLVEEKKRHMRRVVEDVAEVLNMADEVAGKNNIIVAMENTSFNYKYKNRNGKEELTGRDEVAWLYAEEFSDLGDIGVYQTLDACHVMLQRMALEPYLKDDSKLSELPMRLQVAISEYGDVPESLCEEPNEKGLYTLKNWIDVVGKEGIAMVHVNGCTGTGYEAHGLKPGVEGDLIDWERFAKLLDKDTILISEVGGSHIDKENEINPDLMYTLDFLRNLGEKDV